MDSIWDLKLKKFNFDLETQKPLYIQHYAGSMLRGGFGHALRKVSCPFRGQECKDCIVSKNCFYYRTFEQKISKGKITQTPPHPYIIEPRFFADSGKSDISTFDLLLMDFAVDNIAYFVLAFEEFGKRGMLKNKYTFKVNEVTTDNYSVYNHNAGMSKINFPVETLGEITSENKTKQNPTKIRVKIITPLRFKEKGRYKDDLEFQDLIKLVFRRLRFLALAFEKEDFTKEYTLQIINEAEKIQTTSKNIQWNDWTRFSSRQHTKMHLGGIVGDIVFEGKEISKFMQLLKAAELLHIGKNVSFGLGQIKIYIEE